MADALNTIPRNEKQGVKNTQKIKSLARPNK